MDVFCVTLFANGGSLPLGCGQTGIGPATKIALDRIPRRGISGHLAATTPRIPATLAAFIGTVPALGHTSGLKERRATDLSFALWTGAPACGQTERDKILAVPTERIDIEGPAGPVAVGNSLPAVEPFVNILNTICSRLPCAPSTKNIIARFG